jgi:hypothetical protein
VGETVLVPLLANADVEGGRSAVHVVGVVAMRIQGVASDGSVSAVYQPTVVGATAARTGDAGGLGVYAPVLIDTPS